MFIVFMLIWLLVAVWHYINNRRFCKLGALLPGPPSYPLIGHAHLLFRNPEKTFSVIRNLCKDYDRMVALWFGPKLVVLMFDPSDIEIVLRNTKNIEKSDEYRFLRPWLGDGVLLSSGNKFKRNKRIIMKSFHTTFLKDNVDVFNKHALELVKELEDKVGSEEFDVHSYLSSATINMFLEGPLSLDNHLFKQYSATYARAVEKLGRLSHVRAYKIWLHPDVIFRWSKLKKEQDKYIKVINEVTYSIVREKQTQLSQKGGQDTHQFLDNLLRERNENGERVMTIEEIKDEVNTLMFAGLDTTTVSLGFILSLLGIHQEIQDKVVAELEQVVNSSKHVTYGDIQNLHYLEQVIKESWRLYPPVPFIGRKPTCDLRLDERYVLPAGCTLVIMLLGLHRNPGQFPNPHKFNPDNFSPEKIKTRHPYSFLPFSTGQRTCLGKAYSMLAIKVLLVNLLRNYKVVSSMKERDFSLAAQTTLKRREGFLVRLERRRPVEY